MGADMLLTSLPAPRITPERLARLHETIDRLTDADLNDSLGHLDEEPQAIREALHAHVDLLEHVRGRRDVVVLHVYRMPYPNRGRTRSVLWAFRRCEIGPNKLCSSWHWNLNGRPYSSRTVMGSDRDAHATMRSEQSIRVSAPNPSLCWMLTLRNVLIESTMKHCCKS